MRIFPIQSIDFFFLWLGQVLSQGGLRISQIAILWWIVSQHSTAPGFWSASFLVAASLPPLLFVSLIGKIVDRVPSRFILLLCDFIAFLTLSLFYLAFQFHFFSPWVALVGSFCVATCQAFVNPTLNKAVVRLVPRTDVPAAVSFLASTDSLANFGGAVAGAMLISILGISHVVGVSACGYGLSFGVNALIRYRYFPPLENEAKGPKCGDGQSFRKQKILIQLIVLFGLINFFATPTLVILPLYTKFSLRAGASTLALLEAGLWAGILVGSFFSRKLLNWEHPLWNGLGCLMVFGLMMLIPGFFVQKEVFLVALTCAGFALGVNNVGFISLFQEVVLDSEKGQFFSALQAGVSFSFPVAFFSFGILADWLSPPQVLWIQGIGVFCVALLGFGRLLTQEKNLTLLKSRALAGAFASVSEGLVR